MTLKSQIAQVCGVLPGICNYSDSDDDSNLDSDSDDIDTDVFARAVKCHIHVQQ